MGGGASKNKIIPQFTVTIVINGEAIVAFAVCEDATLADARKQILLESEEFSNLPTAFYFNYKGAPFSVRNENTESVREVAGSDSRLILIPKKTEETNNESKGEVKTNDNDLEKEQEEEEAEDKIETALDNAETTIDTVDEINNTIIDNTTEEIQMVQQDGTVTTENELSLPVKISIHKCILIKNVEKN